MPSEDVQTTAAGLEPLRHDRVAVVADLPPRLAQRDLGDVLVIERVPADLVARRCERADLVPGEPAAPAHAVRVHEERRAHPVLVEDRLRVELRLHHVVERDRDHRARRVSRRRRQHRQRRKHRAPPPYPSRTVSPASVLPCFW